MPLRFAGDRGADRRFSSRAAAHQEGSTGQTRFRQAISGLEFLMEWAARGFRRIPDTSRGFRVDLGTTGADLSRPGTRSADLTRCTLRGGGWQKLSLAVQNQPDSGTGAAGVLRNLDTATAGRRWSTIAAEEVRNIRA